MLLLCKLGEGGNLDSYNLYNKITTQKQKRKIFLLHRDFNHGSLQPANCYVIGFVRLTLECFLGLLLHLMFIIQDLLAKKNLD